MSRGKNNRSVVPEAPTEVIPPMGDAPPKEANSSAIPGANRAPPKLRAIGYIRVSTEEQASEGISLEAQRAKLAQYAVLHDLHLIRIVEDAGKSAKDLDRLGLAYALSFLVEGTAEGLLIAKLDRLSRSVGDWASLIDRFFSETAGKQLWSVNDSVDTRKAAGRLVLNVLMCVAQWEREMIAERTREALAHKKAQGKRYGPVPYGADHDAPTDLLIPNLHEQQILKDIQELAKAGESPHAIARTLNAKNVPTKTRKGPWSPQAVAAILRRLAS